MNDEAPVAMKCYKNKCIPVTRSLTEYIVKPKQHDISKLYVAKGELSAEKPPFRNNKKPTALKKIIENSRFRFDEKTAFFSYVESEAADREILDFIKNVKIRFDNKWKQNQNKARAHRVMVCGVHEILKHIKNDNIVAIFVSRNIDSVVENGAASYLFHELLHNSLAKTIPVIHVGTKKSLSFAVKKYPYTNVIGLICCPGFEQQLSSIIDKWKNSRSHILYHIDQHSFLP